MITVSMGKTKSSKQVAFKRSSANERKLQTWRQGIASLGLRSCYQVGGAVRDTLLGKEVADLDICVVGHSAAELGELLAASGRCQPLIVAERVIGYRFYPSWGPPEGFELALARREISTGPGHGDFAIDSGQRISIIDDLQRRDFTVNALAQEINPDGSLGPVIDPGSGAADLQNKILKTTSAEIIAEDPLRILRGLVRLAVDDFVLAPETAQQFREHCAAVRYISVERLFQEVNKIITAPNPAGALRQARDLGVYQQIFPELTATIGFQQQSKYHHLTVDEHCLLALEQASNHRAPEAVRWAALLHDSGKPASAWRGVDGRLHYYRNPEDPTSRSHQQIGAEISGQLLERLRAPKQLQENVQLLVAEHMFNEDRNFAQRSAAKNARSARKLIARVGIENIDNLLLLRRCDLLAKKGGADLGQLPELQQLISQERRQPLAISQLAINGDDLQHLGLSGPAIGAALQELLSRVINEPEHNTRRQLLRWAQQL